ncbi:hypothetical protein E2542_SST16540 [Spatholobus suberectus]|nr:hypothetical protein E2542_SST16540 [Spatholobus suberectus]
METKADADSFWTWNANNNNNNDNQKQFSVTKFLGNKLPKPQTSVLSTSIEEKTNQRSNPSTIPARESTAAACIEEKKAIALAELHSSPPQTPLLEDGCDDAAVFIVSKRKESASLRAEIAVVMLEKSKTAKLGATDKSFEDVAIASESSFVPSCAGDEELEVFEQPIFDLHDPQLGSGSHAGGSSANANIMAFDGFDLNEYYDFDNFN